jgi:hypothetical protein
MGLHIIHIVQQWCWVVYVKSREYGAEGAGADVGVEGVCGLGLGLGWGCSSVVPHKLIDILLPFSSTARSASTGRMLILS